MNNQSEQYFLDLLSLKLSGDANEDQLLELEQLLKLHPSFALLHNQVTVSSFSAEEASSYADQAYASHYVKMQLKGYFDEPNLAFQQPKFLQPIFAKKKLFLTGIGAVVFVLIFIFYSHSIDTKIWKENTTYTNEIATKKGSKSFIKLPDGSKVWLNTDSKLSYMNFTVGKTREVRVEGEAFFDVAHDSSRPFIIHTGKINIKVLGTTFNVRNYPEDTELETSLIKGKIEVTLNSRPEDIIILNPKGKLIISKKDDRVIKKIDESIIADNKVVLTSITYFNKDSLIAETSWLTDKLVFVNQPLAKIALDLERKYAITISFKNAEVKNYRYTGVFENVSLEKVFELIKYSKNINYRINDREIIIE